MAFGRKGRGKETLDVIAISISDFVKDVEKCIGLPYGQWTIFEKDKIFAMNTQKEMEELMDRYCLNIPLPEEKGRVEIVNGGRTKKKAIVFDDWDIITTLGIKDRPELCELLFG